MKRNSVFTKIAALMLCVMMVIGCLPMSAFAQNITEGEIDVKESEATLVIGDNELVVYTGMATTIYTYVADAEGKLSITMPNYIGWSYVLKNGTTNYSVSSDTVIDPKIEGDYINANPSVNVKIGEVVTLTVTTNGQTKPVTTNIVASFEDAQGIQANPYKVNIDSFRNYFSVAAQQTAYFIITSDDPEYGGTTEFQGNMIISAYGVNFSGYCGRMPIVPVLDDAGYYVATVPVQYTAGMMVPQFTIDAAEEVGVNIRFEVPVGTNLNPADMNVGSVEEPGVNTSTAEYWFRYYAGENGTVTIKMTSETWAYIAEYVNTNDVVKNSGTIYSDTADAQSTLVYEVVAGDRINIMLMPYDADSASFNAWFEVEAEEPEVTEPEQTDPPATEAVAKNEQTGKTYSTVAEALNAATSGQTVTMVDDSDEKDAVLVLKADVTLDLKDFTLEAGSVVGLKGSGITAVTYGSTTDGGILKVEQGSISLSSTAKDAPTDNYYAMPIWNVEEEHYNFTTNQLNVVSMTGDAAVGNGSVDTEFGVVFGGTARRNILKPGTGLDDNGISVIVSTSFINKSNIKVTSDYYYTATLQEVVLNSNTLTCGVANCEDYSGLTVKIKIVSETGVVISSQEYSYSELVA